MRIVPGQVGLHQMLGDDVGVVSGRAGRRQDVRHDRLQVLRVNVWHNFFLAFNCQ